jgi:hypothetical protein
LSVPNKHKDNNENDEVTIYDKDNKGCSDDVAKIQLQIIVITHLIRTAIMINSHDNIATSSIMMIN